MYELRLNRKLTDEYFKDMPKEIRDWIVNAIGSLVVADGIVEEHEFLALREAIGMLDSREEIENMLEMIKQRKLFTVDDISVPLETASGIFFYLASIAVVDGSMKRVEGDLLKSLGPKLGLPNEFVRSVMRWAMRQMEHNKMWSQGQAKLLDAKVLCVGAGGLGSPVALYLAAAGVGTIGIVDHDTVDMSNLQRQILHTNDRVGMPKVESAQITLNALNPDVNVVQFNERLSSENVMRIIKDFDIVVNGCDNFPTRYLINDACIMAKKILVDGSIFQFEGQVTVVDPNDGPCYRCLFPEPPPPGAAPSCAEAGVLGVLPGIVGCIQATEIIKLALGEGDSLVGRLLIFNALEMKFREVKLRRDPKCPLCGDNPTVKELIDYNQFCGIPDQPEEPEENPDEVDVQEMKRALDNPDLGIAIVDVRNTGIIE